MRRTQPGIVKGKFAYLAPEQTYDRLVDPRTDVFAAGIVLWEALASRHLFRRSTDLKTVLVEILRELAPKPGLTGAHLLVTDTPTTSSPTTEQQIRGADGAADWIVLLSGYDLDVVQKVVADQLSSSTLRLAGACENSTIGYYRLAFTMTPLDLAAM